MGTKKINGNNCKKRKVFIYFWMRNSEILEKEWKIRSQNLSVNLSFCSEITDFTPLPRHIAAATSSHFCTCSYSCTFLISYIFICTCSGSNNSWY